jgi:hypothetical protein
MRSEPCRVGRKSSTRMVALCAVVGGFLVACGSASGAVPRYECPPAVADCTTVTGAWIDVPASGLYPNAGYADAQLTCPSSDKAIGYSYQGGVDGQTWVFVQIYQQYPNTQDPWNPAWEPGRVQFSITNWAGATTVQPRIGCVPLTKTGSSAPARSLQRERVWTATLRPSEVQTYTHGCAGGTRLIDSDNSVEFLSRRRPSQVALAAVKWRATESRNEESVQVTTGAGLGSAQAVLEMVLVCAVK